MNSIDEFVTVVREELGLAVSLDDADRTFDELPGWDSLHLLALLAAVERRTGRSVSLPSVLEARSLEGVYAAVMEA